MPTTLEELPAGFWDDDGPTESPPAPASRRDAPVEAPSPSPPPPPAAAPAASRSATPPALASLQGLALLQAVFPGRVVKVERAATADDEATTDEAVVAEPVDAAEDEPETDPDAPPARTP